MLANIFDRYKAYSVLILRLVLGAVLINHGYAKLFGGLEGTAGFFAGLGIPAAPVMAAVVGSIEFFGGILILIGLLTRLSALLVVLQFSVILVLRILPGKLPGPFSAAELDLLVFAIALVLLFKGGKEYSVDAKVIKKELI